jgi:thiamine-monophosphate kinase
MTELELVRWLRSQGKGIGDYCAILPHGREDLLVTTDFLIENVHFLRNLPPETVGHRALARGLSDIAAMGGVPRWCLVSLALADWADTGWVRRFYRGLKKLARRFRCDLVGGDLSHASAVAIDIVVIGETPRGAALRRSTAHPGDAIYVSGGLGGQPSLPEPRVNLGRFLRSRATACMDLSDGLSIDLHRLCVESRVAAVIDHPLPVAPGATLEDALHRGEDYELLFTARRSFTSHRGLPLTRIGSIVKGPPGRVSLFGLPLEPLGYDHFAKRRSQTSHRSH